MFKSFLAQYLWPIVAIAFLATVIGAYSTGRKHGGSKIQSAWDKEKIEQQQQLLSLKDQIKKIQDEQRAKDEEKRLEDEAKAKQFAQERARLEKENRASKNKIQELINKNKDKLACEASQEIVDQINSRL